MLPQNVQLLSPACSSVLLTRSSSQAHWVLSFSLIWAGQWLWEQMVAYLWSPVDDFRGFSSVALELLRLHQEGPVSVWTECHSSAVQPRFHAAESAVHWDASRCCALSLHQQQSRVATLPKYRILQQLLAVGLVIWSWRGSLTQPCCFSSQPAGGLVLCAPNWQWMALSHSHGLAFIMIRAELNVCYNTLH